MISVEKALQIIAENTKTLDKMSIDSREALQYVLASDIQSPMNLPPFPQSAMDGYACKFSELFENKGELMVKGESKAGSLTDLKIEAGSAMRIFTGAPVPNGADCIVIQEDVKREGDKMTCTEFNKYEGGKNIRPVGEEISEGEVVLKKGHRVNSATIGLLISMGITKIQVYRKPRVGILITGSELADINEERRSGQIYESNSHTLMAAMHENGFIDTSVRNVPDNFQETVELIREMKQNHDVLITSGGISVGDYDFVGKSLHELGVKEHFYKIRQKPGKPMFYGHLGECNVFALPGNPGSMLTCFFIYVLPALWGLSGDFRSLPSAVAKLAGDLRLKGDRAHFLKAYFQDGGVNILKKQNSSMLSDFALSNCLAYIPEGVNELSKGDDVNVIHLHCNL